MLTQPQVKCEGCRRLEVLREEDQDGDPLASAKKRLRKRCLRAGHTSLPIYTQPFEMRPLREH